MTQYAALIYTRDVDWSRPDYAEQTKQYAEFGAEAADQIRGGAALYQTSTATTVRVDGGRGGDVVTTDGPYAETKEALTGSTSSSAPTSTRPSPPRPGSPAPGTAR